MPRLILLFETNPAMVVNSFEDRIDLLHYKGTTPTDPEEGRLARSITNAMDRLSGFAILLRRSIGLDAAATIVIVVLSPLEEGRLSGPGRNPESGVVATR
jgi:hypothetical protein